MTTKPHKPLIGIKKPPTQFRSGLAALVSMNIGLNNLFYEVYEASTHWRLISKYIKLGH